MKWKTLATEGGGRTLRGERFVKRTEDEGDQVDEDGFNVRSVGERTCGL